MASSWRYPHHLHKHQDSRCMTSFRLPMPNLPPLRSPPSTSCPLASLPAKSRRWHKGRPRVRHRECRPCELASKESDSSSNSVSLPQMKVSRADEEGRTRRHNSKGDYCKVVNLRIPLLPGFNWPSAGGPGVGEGSEEQEVDFSPCSSTWEQRGTRPPTPTLSRVELVAFDGDRVTHPVDKGAHTVAAGSPLHASSFLPSLAYQRRNTFSDSPHHSKVPRHPHPSTAYPNFSLSCTKLHLPHPSPRSHNHTLGNCVLRFTHGSREHDITSPARLQVHLAELRLLDPHQLLWTYRQNHGHSPYTCPTKSTTTIPPSPGPVADCEPNNQRVGMERETEVPPQLHQKRNSNRSDRVYTVTRMYRKTASYPDPLLHPPPGYQRRLAQLALLVSETITWELGRRRKKRRRTKAYGSEGSI